MDPREGEGPSPFQRAQRRRDELPGRGEEDRGVRTHGDPRGIFADPRGAHRLRHLAMGGAARADVRRRTPVQRELQDDVGGGAEAVEGQ